MEVSITDYPAGAALATDLVTTSPAVRGVDALAEPDALADLLSRHGIRGEVPTADDVFAVRLLRFDVRGTIETETAEQAVAGAGVLIGRAALGPVLRRDDDRNWQWYVPTAPGAPLADRLAAVIGVALLGVVRSLGHDRFRACAAPGCRGVFVDASRAGRRRYCTPELCGNRVNVANHRRRQEVTR
ncbi:CGNR zinc finger domain-containing protein [Actinosynnema sp. NPDC023587]|uniref:CGNR zinc finger domain-containing protein n=1 Tax=Actinosynnema sp. NPDC023587 TaxID=3154695 RepID=UPI0033E766F3